MLLDEMKALPACMFIALLTIPASLQGQERSVALLSSGKAAFYASSVAGIKQKLAEKGTSSVLSCDITDEAWVRTMESRPPAVIVTVGSKATEAAIQQFPDTAIVFTMVLSPRYTSARVTGVSLDIPPRQQFKMAQRLCPQIHAIGVIYSTPAAEELVSIGKAQASSMGLEVIAVHVASVDDVYSAIRFLGKRTDALWMIPDTMVFTPESTEDLLLYALREKIPVIGLSPSYVKAGALFSLSCDYEDIGRQSGEMAQRIIDGDLPAAIPLEGPARTDLAVNLITAERIGVRVPASVRKESRYVYQ